MLSGCVTKENWKLDMLIYLTDLDLKVDLLRTAPKDQLILLVTLTYLIKHTTLLNKEAFMILEVLHAERAQNIEEDIEYPMNIDGRGFKVSVMLLTFYRIFEHCLNTIGFKSFKVSY